MSKLNKTCVICGESYSYCNKCGKDAKKPTWMNLFDNENCMNIYTICTDFRDGAISADVAKERIAKCDLSKINNFNNGVKELIAKINADSKVVSNKDEAVKEKKIFKKED